MTSNSTISLRGVRVHNLRGLDVQIPLGKMTAVTGVCGAGKSSLIFDTLFAEAQRRYLQSFSVAIRQQLERFDKPDVDHIDDLPVAVAVRRRNNAGPRATVGSIAEIDDWLRMLLVRAGTVHCPNCQERVRPSTVEDVAKVIQALPPGQLLTIGFPITPDPDQDLATWAATLREEGFVRLQIGSTQVRLDEPMPAHVANDARIWVLVDRVTAGQVAVERLRDAVETAFTRGDGRAAILNELGTQSFDRRWFCPSCALPCPQPQTRLLDPDDPLGGCATCAGTGLEKKSNTPCPACRGMRWNQLALCVHLGGKSIADLSSLSVAELADFIADTSEAGDTNLIRAQLTRRLTFLREVGLGYLPLLRPAATLATGEWQRLQLCAPLTSNLVGALYLLDEPAAGLHPRDRAVLLAKLQQLCNAGNTVVLIEHDADFIRAADHVIDLGPGAGEEGGSVVVQGSPTQIAATDESVTGEYLGGSAAIAVPSKRRQATAWLHLLGANLNHLQNLTVDFPLGILCAVTGVSGAGKSSLIVQTLFPCLARLKEDNSAVDPPPGAQLNGAAQITQVLLVDQKPLPRSARSNAATYLKILDDIRDLFAETAEAKIRGFAAGHFSFNQPGGRCDACEGQGTLTVDMQFLADIAMTCPECRGARFKKEILAVKVRSLSIDEVLNLTVREAFRFFRAQRRIEAKLKWVIDVGLEYLRLGQPIDTLSGGESQRLKLAGHLASTRKARCLFILVEPSAGLHPADTQRLLDCLDRLVSTGHSVMIIEHNLDVIKCADYVIDVGPGAGVDGGRVVAQGTPEQIAHAAASATGKFLKDVLVL